jgi:cyclophilin family peptidyl-prolyl cis-trans isomerase
MKRPLTLASVAAAVIALAACSSTDSVTTTTAATPPDTTATTATPTTTLPESRLAVVPRDYEGFRAQPTICDAAAPDPVAPMQFVAPDDLTAGAVDPATATMATSCGDIVIELDPSLAPETVNSFAFLASEGYFDGTVLHRVIPGFIVQGGDPTATGRGGPGYSIPDEFPPAGVGYERGTLAMANAGPGTTGSQFFIVLDSVDLPPQYSVFGRVVEGFDVLDRLQTVPLGQAAGSPDPFPSTPLETIYVDSVTIAS